MFQVLFKMHISYLNKTKLAALITAEIALLYSRNTSGFTFQLHVWSKTDFFTSTEYKI